MLLKNPGEQSSQLEAIVVVMPVRYVPGAQRSHADSPVRPTKRPASQEGHSVASGMGPYVPTGHTSHEDCPGLFWNEPRGHG